MSEARIWTCSFCASKSNEVRLLIAGACCFICDECVTVCVEIVAERRAARNDTEEAVNHPVTLPREA
jgi:ATP-dependent Clp protease ATP-binding subunit ClpX